MIIKKFSHNNFHINVSFKESEKPEVTYCFPPREEGSDVKDSVADSVSEFCFPETHKELLSKVSSRYAIFYIKRN